MSKGTFQFNPPIPEPSKGPKADIPPHIENMSALNEQTKKALAEIEKLNQPETEPESEREEVEVAENDEPGQKEEQEEPEQEAQTPELGTPDERAFTDYFQEVQDVLNNEEQRIDIEARCPAMSLDELLTTGRCTQKVPVVPGSFEAVFQSVTGAEDLFIKDMMYEEKGSDLYISQKFSMMNLAMGLASINGVELPDYETEGKPDKEKFRERYDWLQRLPVPMLVSLQVNYYWFDVRTRKLFTFRGRI